MLLDKEMKMYTTEGQLSEAQVQRKFSKDVLFLYV